MLIGGIDEVGMGALVGPLCVCIAVFEDRKNINDLRDSKKLTTKQRLKAEAIIKKDIFEYAFGWASVNEIEQMNIFHARDLAAQRAFNKLKNIPDIIYTDGNHLIDLGYPVKQRAVVKGDERIWQVSAASILAKNHRDKYMIDLCKTYGHKYDWENNKGYYSPKHNEGMLKHGISIHHRIHFFYVGKILYQRGEISKNQFEKKYNRNIKKRNENGKKNGKSGNSKKSECDKNSNGKKRIGKKH